MRLLHPVPAAVALCATTVIAGGCTTDRGADLGAAGYLADRADVLAERIGDGEPCAAIREGELLVERTWATVSSGELAASTAAHVEEVVTEVVGDLHCEPNDPDPPATDDTRSATDTATDAATDVGTSEATDDAPTDDDDTSSPDEGTGGDDDDAGGSGSRGDGASGGDAGEGGGGDDAPGHGGDPPGHGGDPPGRGGDPPGHGGDPPGHGGDPPGHGSGGDAPGRGGGRGP